MNSLPISSLLSLAMSYGSMPPSFSTHMQTPPIWTKDSVQLHMKNSEKRRQRKCTFSTHKDELNMAFTSNRSSSSIRSTFHTNNTANASAKHVFSTATVSGIVQNMFAFGANAIADTERK